MAAVVLVRRSGVRFRIRFNHKPALCLGEVALEDFEQLGIDRDIAFRFPALGAIEFCGLDFDHAFIPAKRSPRQLVDFISSQVSHRSKEKNLELLNGKFCLGSFGQGFDVEAAPIAGNIDLLDLHPMEGHRRRKLHNIRKSRILPMVSINNGDNSSL
jgi:hypothetical protein